MTSSVDIRVFLGPTLSHADAREVLDAVYCPPAAQGDVLRAVSEGARVLGIVDGYFQQAPSVWHKEILWAISEGVYVFGAASMGALRAAELHSYGMRGVGTIFELFRDNVLTDDDEVAVVHAPQEMGFAAGTTPLVDIRATLQRALEASVLDAGLHDQLIAAAKLLPYWQRTYANLFDTQQGLPSEVRCWVSTHAVQQKRADAIAMLDAIALIDEMPGRANFCLHRTAAFENLVLETRARTTERDEGIECDDDVLDELRLQPELFDQVIKGFAAPDQQLESLAGPDWLAQLRRLGLAEKLKRRAQAKQRWLLDHFGALPEYADVLLTPRFVFDWYFERCNGVNVPSDVERYASSLGYQGVEALSRTLLHEYLFANEA